MSEIYERSIRSMNRTAAERELARPETDRLFQQALSHFSAPIREHGFRGSKSNFYRDFEDVTQIININKARKYSNAFEFYLDINFGIWSPRIRDVYLLAKPPRTESSCQFRYSLLKPGKTPNQGLGWYVCDDESLEIALAEMFPPLLEIRLPQLHRATNLQGMLEAYKNNEIQPLMRRKMFEEHLARVLGEW